MHGGFNIGGINASGQASSAPHLFQTPLCRLTTELWV